MSETGKPAMIQGGAIVGRRDLREDREYEVKSYNFCRPDKFAADQLRTMQMLHEGFAHSASASLSAMIRSVIDLQVSSVDQLTYQEFSDSVPTPTFLSVIQMNPLRGNMVMQLDPAPTSAVIDRLFGGEGRAASENRELTDIELSVMEGLVIRLFGQLRETWSGVIKLEPKLGNLEMDIRYAQIVPPSDMVILVTFKFKIGPVEGYLNFCYPFITLEPILKKLFAFSYYNNFAKKQEGKSAGLHLEKIQYAPLPVRIATQTKPIPLKILSALKPGTTIALKDHDPAFLEVAGSPVFPFRAVNRKGGEWRLDSEKSLVGFDGIFPAKSGDSEPDFENARENESMGDLKSQMAEMAKSLSAGMENLRKAQLDAKEQLHFWLMQKEEGPSAETPEQNNPFYFLEAISPDTARVLGGFLSAELPQLTALVLSQLEAPLAAELLRNLTLEIQVEVVERLTKIERVVPEIIREVARVLKRKVDLFTKEGYGADGLRRAVNLLGQSPRELEKRVLAGLEKSSPEMALAIKQRMIVFEDIESLDDRSLAQIIRTVSREDLLCSLKTAPASLRQAIARNLPKEERPAFEANLEKSEPLRLAEVEAAQLRVINAVRLLEGEMSKR